MSLSCDSVRELLADGEVRDELSAHCRTCEDCAAFALALESVDSELASLPRIDAPDALVDATIARAREEAAKASLPDEVSSPSLLFAAFAVLTTAVGALFALPLTILRWLGGAVRARAARDREADDLRKRSWLSGPTLAVASSLGALLLVFVTWQKFGNTVKTKTRGAEAVVNGLPTTSYEEESVGGDRDWWRTGEAAAPPPPSEPVDEPTTVTGVTAPRPATATIAPTITAGPTSGFGGFGDELAREQGGRYRIDGRGDLGVDVSGSTEDDARLDDLQQQADVTRGPMGWASEAEGELDLETLAIDGTIDGRDRGETTEAVSPDEANQRFSTHVPRVESSAWLDAQRTSGLVFAARDGWWENTYVPGDAALRVLHARLAAAGDRRLSGVSLSALALAEASSPTVPAVAAPTDRAVALGVHADVAAVEGPTRVRMEVAVRGIAQAAGRRGALRIALVVDAQSGLDAAAQTRLRALVTALSRSMGSRDRVMLVASGSHGGTLVELGTLRAGQMEVALRHLFAGDETSGAVSLQSAVESGLEGVVSDDGAGLVLLATPNAAHDAALDQALHVGAVAGVVTTAVGIGPGASVADLDSIALAGQGRRFLVMSESDATSTVRSELTAAARLVARALRIRVRLAPGVQLVDVVGSRALDVEESRRTRETERAIDQQLANRLGITADRDDDQDGIRILLPSFYSGDSHTVMLDLVVPGPGPVADVDVQFKDLVRLGNGSVSSALALASGRAPRGPHEERVIASYLAHEVASALETAGDRVASGDWASARGELETARALIAAARAEVPHLASSPSVRADDTLLQQYVSALAGGDAALVADSLHYAAARRIVLPQLATSDP